MGVALMSEFSNTSSKVIGWADAASSAAEENQNLVQSSNEIINTSSTSISADAFEPDYTDEVFEEDKDYYTDQIVDALLNLPIPKAEVIEKKIKMDYDDCLVPDYIKIDISPFQLKALKTMVLQAEKKEDLDYFRIAQAALQVQQSWWPLMENTNGYTFKSSDCFEEFLDFINDRTGCSDYSDYVE